MKPAEAAFLKAIELDPGVSAAYVALGRLYVSGKEYDQALAKLDDAVKVNAGNLSALMLIGLIHQQLGDIPKAMEAYERLLAVNPRFAPAANNLAFLYAEQGREMERALDLAYRARAEAPEDPHVADTLGWILYKMGKIELALTSLQLSAAKLPDNPEVQYHLGVAYHKQGNGEASRQALQQALKLSSDFPGAEEARRILAEL